MNFIRKNISNILFVLFVLFLFSPYGLPVRALLIKGVSVVTTQLFGLEIDERRAGRSRIRSGYCKTSTEILLILTTYKER